MESKVSEFFKSPLGFVAIMGLLVLIGAGILWYAFSVIRGFEEQIRNPILY